MSKEYISVVQVANRLKVSITTIYNYYKNRNLGYRCITNKKRILGK